MVDNTNREIKYMRLSITDSCNFRCSYCMPDGPGQSPHNLSIDDIELIASKLNQLGITKVKLTGGEPLTRSDLSDIVAVLKNKCNINQVTLTTNGALLDQHLSKLEQAGLDGITISIDTLDETKFNKLVKRDYYKQVINNIILAKHSSIPNIKLNVVPLKKFGDDNIIDLVNFANDNQIPIRFIEMMPIGLGRKYLGYNYKEILSILQTSFGNYTASTTTYGNGPASYWSFEELNIEIGLIYALSNKFCDSCNRIRVTSTGHLKQCLHYNYNIDLVKTLATEDGLKQVRDFILEKPQEHAFTNKHINKEKLETLKMSDIGG